MLLQCVCIYNLAQQQCGITAPLATYSQHVATIAMNTTECMNLKATKYFQHFAKGGNN
jgi:hypothetical protein